MDDLPHKRDLPNLLDQSSSDHIVERFDPRILIQVSGELNEMGLIDNVTREYLLMDQTLEEISRWCMDLSTFGNPRRGCKGGILVIGEEINGPDEIFNRAIKSHPGIQPDEIQNITAGSGIKKLYQADSRFLTNCGDLQSRLRVAEALDLVIARVLSQQVRSPLEDVDIVLVPSTMPYNPDSGDKLAIACEWRNRKITFNFALACAAGGSALGYLGSGALDRALFKQLESFRDGEPVRVGIISSENFFGQTTARDLEISHRVKQLFSSGFAYTTFTYAPYSYNKGATIRGGLIPWNEGGLLTYEVPMNDPLKGVIQYVPTWEEWDRGSTVNWQQMLETQGIGTTCTLVPGGMTKLDKNVGVHLGPKTIKLGDILARQMRFIEHEFSQRGISPGDIEHILHQPSLPMLIRVQKQLRELDTAMNIDGVANMLATNGNINGSTIFLSLKDLMTNQAIMEKDNVFGIIGAMGGPGLVTASAAMFGTVY